MWHCSLWKMILPWSAAIILRYSFYLSIIDHFHAYFLSKIGNIQEWHHPYWEGRTTSVLLVWAISTPTKLLLQLAIQYHQWLHQSKQTKSFCLRTQRSLKKKPLLKSSFCRVNIRRPTPLPWNRLNASTYKHLWHFASLIALLVLLFWYIAADKLHDNWQRLFFCLLLFVHFKIFHLLGIKSMT